MYIISTTLIMSEFVYNCDSNVMEKMYILIIYGNLAVPSDTGLDIQLSIEWFKHYSTDCNKTTNQWFPDSSYY